MRFEFGILIVMLVSGLPTVLSGTTTFSHQLAAASAKSQIPIITAEELKEKVAKNEAITIIDVRDSVSYADSHDKIKGAIHVKLRRLKYRLGFPPLKDVPREREVITYCACPSEEASIAAAQILLDAGFKRVRALKGGWDEWRKISGPVEPRPKAL